MEDSLKALIEALIMKLENTNHDFRAYVSGTRYFNEEGKESNDIWLNCIKSAEELVDIAKQALHENQT